MDSKKIGNFISVLRKRNNLTQQELGDKIGLGFRAVSKWERGVTIPDVATMHELASVLGVTTDELITGEFKNNSIDLENNNLNKNLVKSIRLLSICIVILIIITTICLTAIFYIYKS